MAHGSAHRRLHRFEIKMPGLAPTVEKHAQELIYFARDFLADRVCRFLSRPDDGSSSIGRRQQILVLASTNSR